MSSFGFICGCLEINCCSGQNFFFFSLVAKLYQYYYIELYYIYIFQDTTQKKS